MKVGSFILFLSLLCTSCIGLKYTKPDEVILYNNEIKVSGDLDKSSLTNLLTQEPNTKIIDTRLFGAHITVPISHRVYFYHWGEKSYDSAKLLTKRQKLIEKYDKKITKAKSRKKKIQLEEKKQEKLDKVNTELTEGNWRMRWGEEVAVFDSMAVPSSIGKLKTYLNSKGYFKAEIDTTLLIEGRSIEMTYTIQPKQPYVIDSVLFSIKDPDVKTLFMNHIEENLIKGERYDEGLISDERNRVYNLMVNNGYYDFKRQFVFFEVDSTVLDNKRLVVRESIVLPPGKSKHKLFHIDSVVFRTSSGMKLPNADAATLYNNVTYNHLEDRYPERQLDWRIFLEKDSLYSRDLTLQTQRQLSYLDIFKFVNINYDSTGGKFIANIFTSPLKRFQTSSEFGLSVLDEAKGLPGPFVNFNAKSRNLFKSLEIIQFDGNASIVGITNVADQETNYSRLQFGGQFSLTLPQFWFPLRNSVRKRIGKYNPKTKFAVGANFESRREEYERTTLNASMSYSWQPKDNIRYTFTPTDVSFIWSDKTDNFIKELDSVPRSLSSAFDSAFVSFISLGIDYSENKYGLGNTDSYLIRTYMETGGNVLYLAEWLGEPEPFGGLAYYKYAKANVDFRKNNRINETTALAYRINVGVAYAYGDNSALPYEKYFFAGGSNSIRAWSPRRLGPGSFATYDTLKSNDDRIFVNRDVERPGDIVLETSIEFRKKITGFLEYAFFVDAGNVWLLKSSTITPENDGFGKNDDPNPDDGKFRFRTFPREIAVGAGFGLRIDFSFLLLRLDVAYKIIDPAYPLGERFILPKYNLPEDLWRTRNDRVSFNIGIGYPF